MLRRVLIPPPPPFPRPQNAFASVERVPFHLRTAKAADARLTRLLVAPTSLVHIPACSEHLSVLPQGLLPGFSRTDRAELCGGKRRVSLTWVLCKQNPQYLIWEFLFLAHLLNPQR